MATLEKIRSKSVLLVVIIAVALLAFILGDAITNGRNLFGNDTTVAKVGGNKIEYQQFQQKQQELSQQYEEARRQNPAQYAGYQQLLSQQALDQLIDEMVLNEAIENTGIKTSPELLRYYMIENPLQTPEMQQFLNALQQTGVPFGSVEEAYTAVFNPQTVGMNEQQAQSFQKAWLAMESQYSNLISRMIYGNLFTSSFKANKLDKASVKNDYVRADSVKMVRKPYGELDAKTYPVSDDDIKKAYDKQKEKYALKETTKEISFIAVNVGPSDKDRKEAQDLALTVAAEMKTKDGITKETRKNGLDVKKREVALSSIKDGALRSFLQTASTDSVAILPGVINGFTVAKLNNRSVKVDSLWVSYIGVADNAALVKKVLAYANSGQSLDSLTVRFSPDSVQYVAPQEVELYAESGTTPKNLGLQQAVYDSLYNSNGKYLEVNRMEGMVTLAAITKKGHPTEVVSYETASYELHPSQATIAEAREKLQKYINTNNTAQKFAENAQAAGYFATDKEITPSTPAISDGRGYYADSRAVVRWVVMDGKDGEVSKIYEVNDVANPAFYVAAVLNTYNDYKPWDNKDVKEELTAQVRREKAGKAMVDKYSKHKTLEATAQAMESEPVSISIRQVPDAKVKGRLMGSKKAGQLQVLPGDDAVYAIVVTQVTEEPVEEDAIDFGQMFLQGHQVNPSAVLRGTKKIENNIYKFEAAQ